MVSGKSTKKTRSPAPVVSRRQGLPWLTIGAVLVVVALAAGIFYVVFSKTQEKNAVADALAPWTPSVENPDPSVNIPGIYIGANTPATADGPASYVDYKAAIHINADQRVAYNRYPPVGGPHDGTWANCMGIVYDSAVRSENMVHTLEHGAVWITYNPDTISAADLATLKSLVQGQPFTTLTPYPGLDSTISLQAWAHQLKVDSASDERVKQFVTALRQNRWVYPETGATCQQPSFDVTNPPAFDPNPPGADAVPMSGTGGVVNSTEMSVASSDQSVDATASAPVSTAEAPAATSAVETPSAG
ncbi:DUF3105 domain-containing protein [Nakamurella multipartita]|jgi:hypothetical protein|uniref:DUF3105 domain-containing protein n=1 Tax=Nakamurella multipartita (strain ATCC 700099 / DSM 44233 / CIP 104796 / JCM 9543 / NBRC 105858 / Y-104) TaxID=479431 RepID=C8XIA0_NAKMY|nr:DUF3105 domain-containing protein [Nakamurella multipartita]ACV78469.1 hypothetical protein Namu_2091 [Nakamurella multipartita DSM 44233]HOZ58749.1 DUF3105 domain-containing protein [Nakamurella multipartita]